MDASIIEFGGRLPRLEDDCVASGRYAVYRA